MLATGGFPHNRAMLEKLVPDYAPYADLSVASIGDTGYGISMAVRAGAAPYTDAWVIGLYLNSEKKELNGVITSKDKYKDRVFVNEKGLRFTNENLPYLTDAVVKEKAVWGIADSSDPEKVKAALKYNDPKYAVRGDTWEALAAAMGVPPDALARTMKDYNAACTTGDDKAFGKAKEFLKPFAKPPFFAVRVVPKMGGTIGGVKVHAKFQIVSEDGFLFIEGQCGCHHACQVSAIVRLSDISAGRHDGQQRIWDDLVGASLAQCTFGHRLRKPHSARQGLCRCRQGALASHR